MSLASYLEGEETQADCTCSCCDNVHNMKYIPTIFHSNITHNLGLMADEAGIYEYMRIYITYLLP